MTKIAVLLLYGRWTCRSSGIWQDRCPKSLVFCHWCYILQQWHKGDGYDRTKNNNINYINYINYKKLHY